MDTAYDEPGHAILFTRSRELVVSCSDEILEVVYMSSILCTVKSNSLFKTVHDVSIKGTKGWSTVLD